MADNVSSVSIKDTHLGLIVPSELKEALKIYALNEGRSVNSVCNSWISERIDMDRRGGIPSAPYELPAGFTAACRAHGISREDFFRACAEALVSQTKDKTLIAIPPEFVPRQDRSDDAFVKDRWKRAIERKPPGSP